MIFILATENRNNTIFNDRRLSRDSAIVIDIEKLVDTANMLS